MLPRLLSTFTTLASLAAIVLAASTNFDRLRALESRGTGPRCGNELTPEVVFESERIFTSLLAEEECSGSVDDTPGNFTIPVYFNVIYAGPDISQGNISDVQIYDQIDVLNNDYRHTGLNFELEGIIRTFNEGWFKNVLQYSAEDTAMKNYLRQGDAQALNVYTVGFGLDKNGLGFATFPVNYSSYPMEDGVVVIYSSLPGGSNAGYDLGRTLTHEVGHWVGLYHTFEGENCTGPGDYVDDTPAEAEAAYWCQVGRDTCSEYRQGPDPVTNFMDYSGDYCVEEFTPGQIARLKCQLKTFRKVEFSPPPQGSAPPPLFGQTLAEWFSFPFRLSWV